MPNTHLPRVSLLAVVAVSVLAGCTAAQQPAAQAPVPQQPVAQQPAPQQPAAAPAAPPAAAPAVPAAAPAAGIYSEAQAEEGQKVFEKSCASCHEVGEFTNRFFKAKWSKRPLFDLFEQTRTTMPDDNPGSLPREQYGSVVAYILKLNGLPAGSARFSTDSASLAAITLNMP